MAVASVPGVVGAIGAVRVVARNKKRKSYVELAELMTKRAKKRRDDLSALPKDVVAYDERGFSICRCYENRAYSLDRCPLNGGNKDLFSQYMEQPLETCTAIIEKVDDCMRFVLRCPVPIKLPEAHMSLIIDNGESPPGRSTSLSSVAYMISSVVYMVKDTPTSATLTVNDLMKMYAGDDDMRLWILVRDVFGLISEYTCLPYTDYVHFNSYSDKYWTKPFASVRIGLQCAPECDDRDRIFHTLDLFSPLWTISKPIIVSYSPSFPIQPSSSSSSSPSSSSASN
jgi:hypothetical protein